MAIDDIKVELSTDGEKVIGVSAKHEPSGLFCGQVVALDGLSRLEREIHQLKAIILCLSHIISDGWDLRQKEIGNEGHTIN